jgi:NCAIR mutase (PurE)-related protein
VHVATSFLNRNTSAWQNVSDEDRSEATYQALVRRCFVTGSIVSTRRKPDEPKAVEPTNERAKTTDGLLDTMARTGGRNGQPKHAPKVRKIRSLSDAPPIAAAVISGVETVGAAGYAWLVKRLGVHEVLEEVKAGRLSTAEALEALQRSTEIDLGFARLDADRPRRRGMPEVVYGEGKTSGQIIGIFRAMSEAGHNAYATRISETQAAEILRAIPEAVHHPVARAITLDKSPLPKPTGLVAVVCAGTSDIPVAEEAALTAGRMGAVVARIFDVGVAGLHRMMKHLDVLRSSRAVVVVAGMEGALPSVVAGMIDKPVIAVPTSVGYGANLSGLTTLLAMLNSCASGVTVVNIDNGFGAGIAAALINRTGEQ